MRLNRTLTVICGAALAITLALALDITPLLRGGAGWRWPYEAPAMPFRLVPGIVALLAYLGFGLWLVSRRTDDEARRVPHGFLAYCLAGGLIVQLAFLSFYGNPIDQLFRRTVSTLSGGFFEVGVAVEDVPQFLRDYPDLMADWSAHPRAHPPGTVLSFRTARALFDAMPGLADRVGDSLRPDQCHHKDLMALSDAGISAALVGMILPLVGLIALWPGYALARKYGDDGSARLAALWLPLIPAYVMFTPQFNQVHVLWTVMGVWLLDRGLTALFDPAAMRRGLIFMALAGVWASVATWQSFTSINLLGFMGVYGIAYALIVGRRMAGWWRQAIIGALVFLLGLASIWIVYFAFTGWTPFDLLSTALGIHYELQEPYLPWLFFFPMDFMLFSGIVLALLAGAAGVRAIRAIIRERGAVGAEVVLPIALLASVIGLTVSGVSRGEVGRLLLILMPLVVIAAAQQMTRDETWERSSGRWLASGALAIQIVVMVAFLPVIGTGLADPPVMSFVAADPSVATSVIFSAPQDGSATLTGYDATLTEEGDLDLSLHWRAGERFDHSYFVGVIVVDANGSPIGVLDWIPVEGSYPTSCWLPDQRVVDQQVIALDQVPEGEVWLSLSLFELETREGLQVTLPDGSIDTQVGLGPILLR